VATWKEIENPPGSLEITNRGTDRMAKKKTRTRAPQAKATKPQRTLSIPESDDEVKIDIIDDNGEVMGSIESTICDLHKMTQVAVATATEQIKNADTDDVIRQYAEDLTSKFKVKVREGTAYRIFYFVIEEFEYQKKITNT
jgi:hypothetical protein